VWSITLGRLYDGSTEAFVAEAVLHDGTPAVLKLLIPRDDDGAAAARNEITVLRLANGEGCVRLLRDDAARSALLLERLGRPLSDLGLPVRERHAILGEAAAKVWREAPDSGLPTGADRGGAVAAHDHERAVLVHGDVHQWNVLQAGSTRPYTSETERRQALAPWLHMHNHHRSPTALGGLPPASRVPNLTGQNT
jgi:streptomycin 6-kinase